MNDPTTSPAIRLVVDGIVYGFQKYGGINTYFNHVLPRIASRPNTVVELLVPRRCNGATPGPPVRRLVRDLLPTRTGLSWRFDEGLRRRIEPVNLTLHGLRAMSKRNVVFQSTYLTSLPTPIPHVAIAHDLNHELFPHLYTDPFGLWLRRRYPVYLRSARRVIAVSQTTKRLLSNFYQTDPALIDVVYHATDPSMFFVDRGEERRDYLARELHIAPPYLLYVGVHSSAFKNFRTLLDAFARLASHAPWTLVVAGPPWDRQQEDRISQLPRGARVRLVPHPDDALLRMLYNFATAFVYPSLSEGFGIPLLEAMACGTPIVASDIPIFREVAGDAPLYFDLHDPDDLARTLERCLDEATRQEHVARGFREAVRYSWDKSAADTYAVYAKALRIA